MNTELLQGERNDEEKKDREQAEQAFIQARTMMQHAFEQARHVYMPNFIATTNDAIRAYLARCYPNRTFEVRGYITDHTVKYAFDVTMHFSIKGEGWDIDQIIEEVWAYLERLGIRDTRIVVDTTQVDPLYPVEPQPGPQTHWREIRGKHSA